MLRACACCDERRSVTSVASSATRVTVMLFSMRATASSPSKANAITVTWPSPS